MSQPSPPETGNSFNALRRHTIGASGQAVRFAVGGGARRTSLNAWGSTQFCESFQPSGEELDAQWEHTLGKYGGLPTKDAREIASIFSNAELPAPSKDSLVYMTHEFMISLGVTAPGDRARVMLALDRMPPPQTQTAGEEERGLASSKNKNASALPRHVLSFSDDTDQVRVFTRRSNTGSCTWYDLVGKDPMPPEGGGTSEYLNQLSLLQSHFARKMASAAAAASNGRKRSIAPIMVIDSRAGFSPQEIPVLSAGASREGSRDASGPEEKRNSVDTSSEIWDILSMKTPLPHMITDSQRRNRVSFILRVCTTSADLQDASFSALTNKWVVFADEDMGLVATVHRVDSIALATMRERDVTDGSDFSFGALICQIIVAFLQEFEVALDQSGDSLDDAESALLDYSKHDHLIELLYHLDRRASVYERLIDLNKQLVNELGNHFGLSRDLAHLDPQWTRLRDKTQNLGDRSQNLLSLLLSLSGHRTNTLMSLLTKFSLVFIPLTFITGVYGMNFDNMPELNYENSYYVCASLMIAFLIFGFIAASRL